jgi:hypothetical protein
MADDPKTAPQIDSQKVVQEISWLGARLREPSTYAGLALVLGAVFHVGDAQDWASNLQSIGMGVGGIVAIALPEGKATAKVAALLALCILGVSLLAPMPAQAANTVQFTKLKSAVKKDATAPAAAPQKTVDPITWLRNFGTSDLQNALNQATTNNNLTTKPCWTYLLGLAQGSTPSLLPNQAGVATFIETAFDDEQVLANWFAPNGAFDQLNIACAPMYNKAKAQVGIAGAGIAAAIAGGPTGTAALWAAVQALLTGATALVPINPL